jgi:hypothetical protein
MSINVDYHTRKKRIIQWLKFGDELTPSGSDIYMGLAVRTWVPSFYDKLDKIGKKHWVGICIIVGVGSNCHNTIL